MPSIHDTAMAQAREEYADWLLEASPDWLPSALQRAHLEAPLAAALRHLARHPHGLPPVVGALLALLREQAQEDAERADRSLMDERAAEIAQELWEIESTDRAEGPL
jgi:hypothetical protein